MHRICLALTYLLAMMPFLAAECAASPVDKRSKIGHLSYVSKLTKLITVKGNYLTRFHLQEFDYRRVADQIENELVLLVRDTDQPIKLREPIQQLLLYYFVQPPTQAPFDCKQFVLNFFQNTVNPEKPFEDQDWRHKSFNKESEIQISEVVVLSNDQSAPVLQSIVHVAIKIAENLYISKAGLSGDFLLISDLETMSELWNSVPSAVLALNSMATHQISC